MLYIAGLGRGVGVYVCISLYVNAACGVKIPWSDSHSPLSISGVFSSRLYVRANSMVGWLEWVMMSLVAFIIDLLQICFSFMII